MTRIVVGLFDSVGDAERAAAELARAVGDGLEAMELHGSGIAADRSSPDGSRAASLLIGWRPPADDMLVLREGVRRGGVVVAARVALRHVEAAAAAIEACGAADIEARAAQWRREGRTGAEAAGVAAEGRADAGAGAGWLGGYTGHDEDIGFATYGGDAVVGRIPQHHRDDQPAGLLGRMEMAVAEHDPARSRARVRVYVVPNGAERGVREEN
ncbi:hypothetical protein [Caldovatus aquaticus]|uniref:Uncharacterized protein n=1 Tax=Caldovatus aquaticus TaxID=2865671 RepID=A0ABS7F6L0_9PROT|nr:hypothetical protein [Caldovatus aquaticus]MBW8271256.1 hypothetical protein [Caldovatus aquaticus]